jgi:sugar phosphate isomerase/epimerase
MKEKLAVQLFTLRDFTLTADDFAKTLKRVADIGYPAVQLSAVGCMGGESPSVSPEVAKTMLDDSNLRCIATHRAWDSLRNHLDEEIAYHKTLDCDYCAIGTIPKDTYAPTYDGYRRWLDDARPIIAGLKAEGIRFGHHNHSREFFKPERHGKTLEDILIDEGGADLMMELDLKDKEPFADNHDSRIAAVGEGSMDWKHIIPACERAGVDWYTMEQDICPRDPFDCLQSSFDYMTNKKWEN